MKAEGRRDAVNIEIDANWAAAGGRHGAEVWRCCIVLEAVPTCNFSF